ncbi:MAG: hypothetical protein IJS22_01730 [Lachnospiraceae bacterium]|nr:hypothetical protein [Lachnospiraceae bacterium]
MFNPYFDLETGEIGLSISDKMLMDSDGDLLMKMSDNMALDLDSGDIHFVSSFGSSRSGDDEDD